jgi:hypothetical protein
MWQWLVHLYKLPGHFSRHHLNSNVALNNAAKNAL